MPAVRAYGYAQIYAYFLIFLFLVPTFNGLLRPGYGTYYGAMLQVLYSAAFLSLMSLHMTRRRANRVHLFVPLLVALTFLLLICLAALRDAHRLVLSDLFELHRPVFAALIFITTLLIRWDDQSVTRVARAYIVIVSLVAAYSIFEALGGHVAQQVSTLLYKSDKAVLVGKATGPFGGTYVLAAFMLFGLVYSSALFLYLRQYRYLFFASLALLALFLSQSRAGAIALVVLGLSVMLFYWAYGNFRYKVRFYLGAAAALLLLLVILDSVLPLFQNLPYLYNGIERLLARGIDPDGAGSFNERYRQLVFAIQSQDDVPLIGVGIGKGYARLLESYYALYFYRYGAVGIVLSLIIFATFFYLGVRCYNIAIRNGQRQNAAFFVALHLWMYAFPILSLSSAFHDQGKFAVFFYGGLAIMTSYQRTEGRRARLADGTEIGGSEASRSATPPGIPSAPGPGLERSTSS